MPNATRLRLNDPITERSVQRTARSVLLCWTGDRGAGLRWRPLPKAEAPTELRVASGNLCGIAAKATTEAGAENGRRETGDRRVTSRTGADPF